MSKIVVVSNRLGDPSKPATGGLAVALNGALNAMGGLWIGWGGNLADSSATNEPDIRSVGKVRLVDITLSQSEYDDYYLGFSNSVLWPAFHHRADLIDTNPGFLETYRSVNKRFAVHVSKLVEPDDIIWVHDYHLIPLAAELRAIGLTNRIGFFLHIPLPPSQIMSTVPGHEWLIASLFSYDLIGLQTQADATNLKLYAERQMGFAQEDGPIIRSNDRDVKVMAFPIGVDVEQFRGLMVEPEAIELRQRLEVRSQGRRWITGVERLDYTKGIPERMKIFSRLLEKYPENVERSTLVQIAPPSRQSVDAYSDIREELEQLSGSINGRFARIDWTPIRYIHRQISRTRLAALFSISKVGLITPLRDGMNLVAKEFVAVQPDDDPGVLVLSEFAGAAEALTEALLVNPVDTESAADTLQQALNMSLEERRERHQALKRKVEEGDVVTWCKDYIGHLERIRKASP